MPLEGASERFLPRQVPIDGVQSGGFRFGGMSHQGGLMVLPDRTQAWWPSSGGSALTVADLQSILDQAESLDIELIGTGSEWAVLPQATCDALRGAGLALEVSATRAAVRTFNVLLSENRRVAAALIVVS